MGGRRGSRTQRKHFKQSRENVWKRPKTDSSSDPNNPNSHNQAWQPFATQNPSFDEYYKEQGIVSPEEWDAFMEMLRKPLPAAFRINSTSQFCEDIRSQLENDFMKSLQAEAIEGGDLEPIKPLPWYPDNLAWQSNFSRMQIRKNQTLERFHEFLKLETEIGNISRQEAVSMVPPLFLDVHPHHFVLDMCAAPGSKTFQLLEIIHHSAKGGTLPDAMVLANDLDVQRCNLLIHQTKRMCTANLIVTNHEGQHFPGCRSHKNISNGSEINKLEQSITQLLFDRVLCDVPCSGDGTLRKAPDIWRKWNGGMGNGLHCLQIHIAMRGLSLLKVGGRMVYSTCSMNPVENEAVVTEILRRCGGSVELVDVSSELPQLIRRPGLRKWKIRDKGVWLASYTDVRKFHINGIVPSMFPSGRNYVDPTDNNQKSENGEDVNTEDGVQPDDPISSANNLEEEVSDLPLERCMRIIPHDQNTGAFFIAVLHKVSHLPAIQDKSVSSQGNLSTRNDGLRENLLDQATGEINGLEGSSADGTDEKILEVASEADEKISEVASEADEKISEVALEADLVDGGPDGVTLETISSEAAQAPADKKIDSAKAGEKRKLQIQGKWRGVDPVLFFKDEAIINSIKTFYGIDESFPFSGHLVTRNSETNHVKRIYYVSKSVKDVLELNFRVGQQMKITSVGLKMFERQSSREGSSAPCSFRISSEGLPVILPYVTKQILYASPADFKHLLQYKTIKFADFVDAEFGQKAANLMLGCCVIVLGEGGKSLSDHIQADASTIAIGCWKGRASLSVMVAAIDCQELLERLSARMETEKGTLAQENHGELDEKQDISGENGTSLEEHNVEAQKIQDITE
ncbi:tRNA (cytosine(34)-C(5))-methyltransferase-like [Durio zibethinus]|uniref:tRNA (Cytosine(34)-C(5))-methyltransferase-like n=1 Tax=Durio zibethinus TaxID=66656 RepID=A0A6P5YG30_DURZI|nr:tRNA (cytosine(34)-C(5))-methyltransferase-like [Durio zibethinus]